MKMRYEKIIYVTAVVLFVGTAVAANAHDVNSDRVKVSVANCDDMIIINPSIRQRDGKAWLHAKARRHSPLLRTGYGSITISLLDGSGSVIETKTVRYTPRHSPRNRERRVSHFSLPLNGESANVASIQALCGEDG